MNMVTGLVLLVLLAIRNSQGFLDDVCPEDFVYVSRTEKCYYFSKPGEKLTWSAANHECRRRGGAHLAEITNAFEDMHLRRMARDWSKKYPTETGEWSQAFWIGGKSQWVWEHSDKKFQFTDWYPGEPSDGGEKCLHLPKEFDYQWNNSNCINAYNFICETYI